MKPRLFIGSSVEGLGVAYAIQQNLMHDVEATVWDQGVFGLSQTSIDSLEQTLAASDFGVFVFSPDDITLMRNEKNKTVRDNVLFEFGLFVGKLGRERVFFIIPDGSDTHVPTDLLGVTPGKYDPKRQDNSLQAATGAACNQIRIVVNKIGFLNAPKVDNESAEDNALSIEKNLEWMHDLIDKKFDEARVKLAKLTEGLDGAELLRNEMWLSFIDLKQNDYNGIQPLIEKIKDHAENIEIQVLGLEMLMWEKYEDKALSLIHELYGEHPQDIKILIIKSECLSSIGEESQAIDTLISKSDDPDVGLKLSELYSSSGDSENALKSIAKAYRESQNNKEIMFRYSKLLIDADKNKEALYLLNRLANDCPDVPGYYGYLSNACLKLGLYDKAMVACRKAFELSNGKEPWIINNIGNMLNNKGFYADAVEWLEKGSKLDSSSEYAHDRLASAIKNRFGENEKFTNVCKEGRILLRTAYQPENLD
ncbi:TIR domain-containing protein [Aeromonas lusitana]|uniref:DNA-binding protein n=1 Tax=Aeromonas lusitana TaxID=931529 RepID=A0A2M8H8L4_9GAMM|nr:TIR domain-containing protein [Aeromonas lusitana]PJC92860.1 DNA-binding protein [Aeromonas lusitana]